MGGRPTLVQNVETLAHLALLARFGADWFRAAGTPEEPGSILLTVSGAVHAPGVYEVAGGTPLVDAVGHAGGPSGDVQAVLVGGYFGGWIPAGRATGLRLGHGELGALGGALGYGVVLALPARVCGLTETARVTRWLAGESAGQCGPCTFGLAAVADAVDALARGRLDPAGRRRLDRWTGEVRGRGACHHPDGAARFVTSALDVFADEVGRHARGRCTGDPRAAPVCPLPAGRFGGAPWR